MTWTKNVGNIDPWFVEAQIHGGVESEFLLQMNQQVSYSARNGLIIIIWIKKNEYKGSRDKQYVSSERSVFAFCSSLIRGRRDRMVVGFTTTYAISAYHH